MGFFIPTIPKQIMRNSKIILAVLICFIVLVSGCVSQTSTCQLSLCDCECHTTDVDGGMVCGVNCLVEYGVSGCEVVDSECVEVRADVENME
jgi:hypothetical protein